MKIKIIVVGKLKEKYLKDGIAEYAKRLSKFCDFDMIEVADEQAPDNLGAAMELQIKNKEGERILKKLPKGSIVVCLEVKGEKLSSEGFAKKLEAFFVSGKSEITFIIGGSLGISESVKETSHMLLSFSDMTFPHQLMRLILVEQVYRSFKILGGETYHK
jgi:23S rRNA (pseudouridine1915-N3)-methyltransferase